MKFNTISKAALMAVLFSTTAPVFGASVVDGHVVADQTAANGARFKTQVSTDAESLILPVHLWEADQTDPYNQMIALHGRFAMLSADNVHADVPQIASQIEALGNIFHKNSIQCLVLLGLARNVSTIASDLGSLVGADTIENRVRNLSSHLEAASRLFRVTPLGGSMQTEVDYLDTVTGLFATDRILRPYATYFQPLFRR